MFEIFNSRFSSHTSGEGEKNEREEASPKEIQVGRLGQCTRLKLVENRYKENLLD